MAQHSNYAKDRDLMMEAYASVQGIVPKTASTSLPRGYVLTEAHCDEESSDGEAKDKFEGEMEDNEQREGATNEFPDGEGKYEVASVGGMHGQSIMGGKKFNSLQAACDAAGVDIKDCYEDVDGWIDMEGDGTTLEFMVDEDTAIVMHKNVPAEDGSCASH